MVTIEKIAATVPDCRVEGERAQTVDRLVHVSALTSDHDIFFLGHPDILDSLPACSALRPCAIVDENLWYTHSEKLRPLLTSAIICPRPRYAVACVSHFFPRRTTPPGVHPAAHVDPTAEIGENASIAAGVVIDAGVKIGANAVIHANVSIGAETVIGDDAQIASGVVISDRVTIGHRIIIQPNAVIGGDGFSFETEHPSPAEAAKAGAPATESVTQKWARLESIGAVEIGDDVEIGSGTTIDRATFGRTFIGNGTKLDNLVQIGHNCVIGENTLLCSQVGIAGSSVVGRGCILAGKVGVADHLKIGDHVVIMAKSGVTKNLPGGKVYYGMPARPVKDTLKAYSLINKLSNMRQRLAAIERELGTVTS